MFNIKFTKANTPAWDEKVKVYDLNEDDKIVLRIYIDLESRSDTKGGALDEQLVYYIIKLKWWNKTSNSLYCW